MHRPTASLLGQSHAVALWLLATVASAQPAEDKVPPAEAAEPEPPPTSPEERERFPQGPLPPGMEKRPVPTYDGRQEPSPTVGDALLWVPRVAFFPLYLASEFVVRRPLGALVTAAEKGHWVAILSDFFTFGEEEKVGLVPTAYLEFDFQPSVGLYFFADDVLADNNDLRIHGALWPDNWWGLTVLNRLSNESDTRRLALRGNLTIRPDFLFHGVGPDAPEEDEARYSARTYEAELLFDGLPWRASAVHWTLGVRKREFSADSDFDGPSLRRAIADPDHGLDALPTGFEGYTVFRSVLNAALDTRLAFPAPAHGVRFELQGEHAFDLEDPEQRRWVRYGGALTGFVDLLNHRVVSLSAEVEMVDPLAGEVPFAELATLGGARPMQGFREGRLFGRSSAAGVFEYRWPVWIWLDFSFHYAVGNVFGEHLSGFELDRLRSSFGFGLRSARGTRPDHSLDFLIAFGTEPFSEGHDIESIRVAVGGISGF